MSEIRLTADQRTAVENRGGRLLVSAAAGSGKTKVLVERLFSHVAEGADVDDFLMITYTKAAAAELRGKIAAELSHRVAEEPENQHLRRQLLRVYQADIKTVDAFCVGLLRENCYLLSPVKGKSLTPDFRVLDEREAALTKNRVLERVLEEFYADMDEQSEQLAETLGAGRDDRKLQELVLELHEKLQSHPYPLKWLESVKKDWENLPGDLADSAYGKILLDGVVRKAVFWAGQLRRAAENMEGDEKLTAGYADRFSEVADLLDTYPAAAARGWEEVAALRPVFRRMGTAPESAAKTLAQSVLKRCKADLKKFEELFSVSQETYLTDMAAMAPAMLALLRLTARFSAAYQEEKVRRNAMDFSDQEHYAIALLTDGGKPTELARRVAERYTEIMVDEYQDSNAVQEYIFSAVSRDGNNLFTVGDVKQSIYRFRLADPTIFLRGYLAYADASEVKDHAPRRVLLSCNFRSRREILDTANFIFRNVMSREMGEMDYGEEERLNYGAEYYLPRTDCAAEFHLISVEDTAEESFDTAAVEAAFVAKRIRELLDGGFPVQEGEGFRPCTPEDIVVLMRSPKSRMRELTKALRRRNIPCISEENGDFFATVEIAAIFSLLQVVDNPHQDVPLISALRSPLFGFTPDRLAAVRAGRDGDFYQALCADESEDSRELLTLLDELRSAAGEMTADELVWYIYDKCRVLTMFGAMAEGQTRRDNLLTFYGFARETAQNGRRSLFDFVSFLRALMERDDLPALATRAQGGGVSIMSIHKSKGLEFPIVILCDLHRRFNTKDMTAPVLVHPELGLGTVRVDAERRIRYDTVSKLAVSRRLTRESKAEEMRILYVAMTRAREKLIMVECMKSARKRVEDLAAVADLPVPPEAVEEARCMGDWVMLPLLATAEGAPIRRLAELPPEHLYETEGGWEIHLWENPTGKEETVSEDGAAAELSEEAPVNTELLEAEYAYESVTVLPSKVTATQLKGRAVDEELQEGAMIRRERGAAFDRPKFMQKRAGLTAAERGTAIHLAMQYLDFDAPAAEQAVTGQLDRLVQRRLMTAEQRGAVDVELLVSFLRSPLCRRIREAEKVYREYRFSVNAPARVIDQNAPEGETVMLQGVADCAFETPEGLVIVDFKTDHITPSQMAERAENYRPQLEAYGYALGKVLELPVAEKVLYFFHTNSSVNL